MPHDETTPLLAGTDTPDISKSPAGSIVAVEDVNKDPEALVDRPKIPGVKLGAIIPAMGIGVWTSLRRL